MNAAGAGLLAAAGALGACSLYETRHFVRLDYEIRSSLLSPAWNGVKAVFISDLHEKSYGRGNQRLKQAIADAGPQMILIGGDMIITKRGADPDFEVSTDLLRFLSARWPVYYAPGNHERRMLDSPELYPGWKEKVFGAIRAAGVHYLSNRTETLSRGGSRLYLTGLDLSRVYYLRGNAARPGGRTIERLAGPAHGDGFNLLLAHNPAYAEYYARWGADCTLSGHFHGGLVRVPRLGGLVSPELKIFSPYTGNLVEKGGMPEIISSGLGTHTVNVRLLNRPQLIVLHFAGTMRGERPERPGKTSVRLLR